MISYSNPTWDIFCKVVDNFGDAGVCWRLARQLVDERGQSVRLWCDDLAALARLCPQADPAQATQRIAGVEIRLWSDPFPVALPAQVVIEAFACELPAGYVAAMATRTPPPVWINLEYLSAEQWIEDCHRRASPHPRLPLLKHFFFPGFTTETGGLIREERLLERRAAFQGDCAAGWAALGLPTPQAGEISVSLFCYDNPALPALVETWQQGAKPVRCFVRQGRILDQLAAVMGDELRPGSVHRRGRLTIHALPFVPQKDFDALLWACDINFVRGEDSFVRAQWAARPLIWHIYPQDDDAHRLKLAAFLDRYCEDMPARPAMVCREFWNQWNRGAAADWGSLWEQRKALDTHAGRWAQRLATQKDLATSLAEFVEARLKSFV